MKILTHPDLRLRKATKRVGPGEDVTVLVKTMLKTMGDAGGVGLAANQVGVDKSLFVFTSAGQQLYCVNPEIILLEEPYETIEGCLSLPGEEHLVTRYKRMIIHSGQARNIELAGRTAQIFQHEIDHLNGRLICDEKEKEELY